MDDKLNDEHDEHAHVVNYITSMLARGEHRFFSALSTRQLFVRLLDDRAEVIPIARGRRKPK